MNETKWAMLSFVVNLIALCNHTQSPRCFRKHILSRCVGAASYLIEVAQRLAVRLLLYSALEVGALLELVRLISYAVPSDA
jgi:hypothetical protein